MTTLEDYKKGWRNSRTDEPAVYDLNSYGRLIRKRARGPMNRMMHYFWASFVYQVILYAFYAHVIATHWNSVLLAGLSLLGMLVYLPFTYTLMKRFKAAAARGSRNVPDESLREHLQHQYETLSGFYRFKKRNEWAIVLASSLLGVSIFFELYLPGGLMDHLQGALITLAITLLSCAAAIWSENNKSFERPLANMASLLADFTINEG